VAEPVEQSIGGDVSLGRRILNIRTIGSIVFAAALLFFLTRVVLNVDFGEIWSLMLRADPLMLLLGLVAYYATFPLRGLRWRFILSRSGMQVRFRDATEILFLSWFVNCLVPAKLGDIYRAYLLRANFAASLSRTVGTIFIERVADIIIIFSLALAAGFWSFRGRMRPEIDALFMAGFVVALLLVVLVIGLRFYGQALTRFLPVRVSELWERFHQGSTGALKLSALLPIGFLTGLIWLAEGTRLYFVIRALELPEVGPSVSAAVFVALAAALLTAIPLTPAGIGFVEAGVVGALSLYGVAGGPALAVALTDRAITILTVVVLGGILWIFSSKIRRAHAVGGTSEPPQAESPPQRGAESRSSQG
jgi:glycosyltransferase 2 family protein